MQVGPIAWEDASLSLVRRALATLAATFQPVRTLRSVAHGPLSPALVFAAWSGLPFMLLWAIVPFTHTLLFGPELQIRLAKGALASQVEPDVLRAAGIGFVLSLVGFFSWALPFASLTRAFCASPPHALEARRAAWRTALYRAWIIPCGFTLWSLVCWAVPSDPSPLLIQPALVVCQLLPRLLVLIHCQAMARYVGASTLGALGVAVVPLAVEWAVGLFLLEAAHGFLPPEARVPP